MAESRRGVAILGIFVADLAFRAGRMPGVGETIIGSGFKMGPGGKGSNQAVAAARAGADVTFISKIGKDEFGAIALRTWEGEGITARVVEVTDQPTGAAYIYVNDRTGENAIIVVPGAAGTISAQDVDTAGEAIRSSVVFVTQLEQPAAAAHRGLRIAREAGVITVFNPAPAEPFDDALYLLCDYVTPNESEATLLTGVPVRNVDDARRAGDIFIGKGVGAALITLGRRWSSAAFEEPIDPCSGFQSRTGYGDCRRGRRLQRRLRRGAGQRRRTRRSSPVWLRSRRHIGYARRHSAFHATPSESRGSSVEELRADRTG